MVTPQQEPEMVDVVRTLVAIGRSYYVEFKTAWIIGKEGKVAREIDDVARDIGETLVALANSDGGDLLVGVEQSGAITGIPWSGDKLLYLVQAPQREIKDATLGLRVVQVEVDGLPVLLFRVTEHPGGIVVTSDGRCLWRNKDRTEPVPPAEIEQRRRHHLGDTYEAQPVPAATLEDLVIPGDLLAANAALKGLRDVATLLRYWNLTEGRNGSLILRRAALLLFAREPLRWHPNNRLKIRRIHGPNEGFGRDLGTQEIEVMGPITNVIPEATARLRKNMEADARMADLFSTAQVLPPEAVDECIVNATAHRNYAIEGSPIEVLLFPDRVEFKSPGKLPEPLTIEDLLRQEGAHRSRNPLIMRVLRDLGWARDQGEGMRRIFGSMSQVELHEPELEQFADTFIVRLSTRSRYDSQTRARIAAYGPYGLEPHERKYVVALGTFPGQQLSVDRLARSVGEAFDETKAQLKQLERKGIVWHAAKSRTYHLVSPLSIAHELAFRRFADAGVPINARSILDTSKLHEILGTFDERIAAARIEQLTESNILTPAGKGRWKLGNSLLEYARARADW